MKQVSGVGRAVVVLSMATAVAACSTLVASPSPPPPVGPTHDTPAGSAIVAKLPVPQYGIFSWSPDGRYLLVGNQNGSIVYDREGRQVSQFPGEAGWLDATHVIGPDDSVRSVADSPGLGYMPNAWVVASGHGSAMVVVSVPGCVGDPWIDWYRDGDFVHTDEQLTPFGWSPDGRFALEGHMTCGQEEAELHGWKGDVDAVEISSGKTEVKLTNVRGELAFSPSGKMLAAQSDSDVEIADIDTGSISVAKGVRLLAWVTDQRLALRAGETLEVADLSDGFEVTTPEPSEILVPSVIDGVALGIDVHGAAIEVRGPKDSLFSLRDEKLAIVANPQPAANEAVYSVLQPTYWSPDGRMLVLPTADGRAIDLISVDPAKPTGSQPSKSGPSN